MVKKAQGSKAYYYLVESARVNGKQDREPDLHRSGPRRSWPGWSGRGAIEPDRTAHRAFGDVAAVWSIIEALDVVGIDG
ncbi:MAG: hypothetical protein R2704_01770 [Microthrixaceae bacterium]